MSLDYDDPSLDHTLTEHARRARAEFTPPGLDGMLSALDSSQPRRRWVWPALAAALLLAIPLVTVLLVRHDRTGGQPAHPAPNSKLVSLGPVPWANPVWTGHAIQFTTTLTHAQACKGVPSIQAKITADSATSVTIVATAYVNPDPAAESKLQKEICADPASDATATYGAVVDLPEPLNGRTAIDGTTHTTFQVVDASAVPSIPGLPPAFHSQGYFSQAEQGTVGRNWADQRVQITLCLYPAASLTSGWSDWKPSTLGLVNGHPTEFFGLDRHTVAWKNGAYLYEIQEVPLNGTLDYEFSPQQLLNLARTVR